MELLHSLLYKYRKNKDFSQLLIDYILTKDINIVIVLKFRFGENEYVLYGRRLYRYDTAFYLF